MMRGVRKQLAAVWWMVVLAVVGLVVAGYIVAHQRMTVPSWVPVVGEDFFELNAEFEKASGVMPGQGQAVTVSGVRVGEIASVDLVDGRAVIRMRIEPRFANVYPDATVLLRPKTGLKDMVVELDPGTPASGPKLSDGATLSTDATDPDVDLDEILASLDADTRDYLRLLVGDGGRVLGDGNGRRLASTFRRFEPLSRHTAEATRLVARRRTQLKRVMSNLSKLARELGARDRELARFVNASAAVFRRFAAQNENLDRTLALLPQTLASTDEALGKVARLGRTLETSLDALEPTAHGLAPMLRDARPFLTKTAPVLRDELRPFAREAQPTVRKLRPGARDMAQATPELAEFARVLNALVDTLAYDPPGSGPGKEGFLFYVPWASHNTNSMLSTQDGVGAMRRGVVLMSCGALEFIRSQINRDRNPTLTTLMQLLNAPSFDDVCEERNPEG
jgi:phospholipid/cholesterol/gamma-HCH transport system substrate-binding protein